MSATEMNFFIFFYWFNVEPVVSPSFLDSYFFKNIKGSLELIITTPGLGGFMASITHPPKLVHLQKQKR
jgi:hypothetical protein